MKNEKMFDAVICGYYGMGNTGDDAILSSIISSQKIRCPGIKLAVISGKDKTADGVTYIPKNSPLSIILALARSKALILGGGNLIQNVTSRRSLWYYLSVMTLAKIFSLRTVIFSNGIGPLKHGAKNYETKLFFKLADLITLRDASSFALALSSGADSGKTFLFADPVFMKLPPLRSRPTHFSSCYAVSLRKCADGMSPDLSVIYEFAKMHPNDTPVFISMQDEYDLDLCKCAADMTHGIALPSMPFEELLSLLREMRFCVGMRLHFLIASAMAGAPTIALSYDTKTDAVADYIGNIPVLPAFDFSSEELQYALFSVESDAFLREKLKKSTDRMKTLAECGADALCDFLTCSDNSALRIQSEFEKNAPV